MFKRGKLDAAEEQLAAHNGDEKNAFAKLAEEAVLAQQTKLLERVIANRDHAAAQEGEHKKNVYQRWLQTMYPAILADRCVTVSRKSDTSWEKLRGL